MIKEDQNWGLIQVDFDAVDPAAEVIKPNMKYWALAQFSRFIRPGAELITARSDTGGEDTVAALGPEPDRLVVVHVNKHAEPTRLRLDLSGFPRLAKTATARRWLTAPGRRLEEDAPFPVTANETDFMVAARSVTTDRDRRDQRRRAVRR